MAKLDTKEQWIAKCRLKHGDKYDYSQADYRKGYMKVVIICPFHGPFEQKAESHTKGIGCKPCGYIKMAANKAKLQQYP